MLEEGVVIEEGGENGVKDGRGMNEDSDRDSDGSWPDTMPARVTNGAPPYTAPVVIMACMVASCAGFYPLRPAAPRTCLSKKEIFDPCVTSFSCALV